MRLRLTNQQTLALDVDCKVVERPIHDCQSGDSFVGLTVTEGASIVDLESMQMMPIIDAAALKSAMQNSKPVKTLQFIPYYFRANRGGRGQMRGGLKAW